MLGKKLYKTSMVNFFRLVILAIVLFFLNDFYLETFTYEKFQSYGRFQILDVLEFHYRYPRQFISFFCIIIMPAVYYAFIRGVRFHEKGFVVNRGIPFLNSVIPYSEVATYKLLHPKVALSIHMKKGDIVLIADNHIERVIAILDQQNIQGDLAQDEFVRLFTSLKKVLILVASSILVLYVIRKLGLLAS